MKRIALGFCLCTMACGFSTTSKADGINSLSQMKFEHIPHGTFMMGSPANEAGRQGDEQQHQVTLTKDFDLAVYPITELEWVQVEGRIELGAASDGNASECLNDYTVVNDYVICPNNPVQKVNWYQAQDFINKLNARGNAKYGLPTEAEFEYALRAGTQTIYFWGDSTAAVNFFAWVDGLSHHVGQKRPNAFGLYEMVGATAQWVQDAHENFSSAAVVDPIVSDGKDRVIKGGLRSASRNYDNPWNSTAGFRIVKIQ